MKHPRVRLAGDGTALTEARDSVLTYRWLSVPVPDDLQLQSTSSAASRHVALPDDDPRFALWAEEARTLCADLEDPEDKLRRIVSHFRRGFYYDPQPSASNGIEAFADFFATRSGYCTYFASATVLYLRANGIPARIATGFLVTEFDVERGAYHARLSDAHAWVEVEQADGSWRTVEPTPTSRRRAAIDAMVAGLDYETLPPVASAPAEAKGGESAATAEEGLPPAPKPPSLYEKAMPLMTGFNTVRPPNSELCFGGNASTIGTVSASSRHQGGAHIAMCDGAIVFLTDSIEIGWGYGNEGTVTSYGKDARAPGSKRPFGLWGALGTRSSNEIIDEVLNQ